VSWRRALLAAALALWAPAAQATRDDAVARYREGLRLYRAGNLTGAVEVFQRAEEADPTYPHPAFALARIYHYFFDQRMRHYEDAVQQYQRLEILLRAEPPSEKDKALLQSYYYQGLLYLRGGEYSKAIESLQKFLLAQPTFSDPASVHNAIGIALYYLDQYDQAVQTFRQALAVNPDSAEARFNLRSVFTRIAVYNEALAVFRIGEIIAAYEKVQRLKEFAPRYSPGRRLEAKLLQAMGRPGDALRVYAETLGFDPSDPVTYSVRLEMARLHEAMGESEAVVQLLTENLRRFPVPPDESSKRELMQLLSRVQQ